ncbi:MAG: prolyl oligopeptidase family serine peptidase [Usitatibacter sp.]
MLKVLASGIVFFSVQALAQPLKYPESPLKPVVDEYFGAQVTDNYRWLEERDPAVKAWSEAQMALTRAALDAIPLRKPLQARFREILSNAPVSYYKFHERGVFFAMKRQPPRNQPSIVVMSSPELAKDERLVYDPLVDDPKGATAIDFYVPSLDGRYLAVVVSKNGSEDGSAFVIDVASGKRLDDVVPRVSYPTAGGSIEWDARSSGFYYTRYPQGNERPPEDAHFYQQVWFHRLGTPVSADTYVIGKEFPRIAEVALSATREGRYLLATVSNGDGGEHAFYLRDPHGAWKRVADFADNVKQAKLGRDGRLFLLSRNGAPRGKVLSMPLVKPQLSEATVLIAEGEDTILELTPTLGRIFVTYMVGGPSEVRVFDRKGTFVAKVPTQPLSSVSVGAALKGGDLLVGSQSYLTPPSWFRYSTNGNTLEKLPLDAKPKVNFDDVEMVREFVPSKDGTRVPVNILMKKGTKRDGSNPLLLYGYGGYGISMRPMFSLSQRVWLDHGGIFAVANLRGGGEFGEAWHLQGNLTKKQNVFDDMIGVAQHLIARGYTSREKLAAMGGSNGGLLMGAILTQRPELFRAIVAQVGVFDMLRVETTPNGAFNVTEYGTVKDRLQFQALYAYSPLHHVKDGAAYPAVLLATGENDGRVDPYHSRKMAARLQAATTSGRPVLLRISPDTGHGLGTALGTRIDEYADSYAFLMDQLGMK